FREQLERSKAPGPRVTIAEGLFGAAAVAAMDDDGELALRLRGAAARLKRDMGAPLSKPEQDIVERYLQPLAAAANAEQISTVGGSWSVAGAGSLALEQL